MMKIITWNVNGLRAVERKGELQNLLEAQQPCVLMLQEIKGNADQFSEFLTENENYASFYSSAEKKGYAGTGIWVRKSLQEKLQAEAGQEMQFRTEIPDAPNGDEGRLSQISFQQDGRRWELLSIYFPNGGKSEQAWVEKLQFYDKVHAYINRLRADGSLVLVGGDMNVAHNEIDLARPKANDGKIGFHRSERAWMDRLAADGWVDIWRMRNPDVADVYSWWNMVSRGRERNVGWRIDYFLAATDTLQQVKEVGYLDDQMGSDHCPMYITL